jgi:hypothetical protein
MQDEPSDHATSLSKEEDEMQQNAKIGTALMLVNSHRFLLLLYVTTRTHMTRVSAPIGLTYSWIVFWPQLADHNGVPHHLFFWTVEQVRIQPSSTPTSKQSGFEFHKCV